jgi:glutathione S-transferase
VKLYFSPMACSMASRILFYEVGAAAEFVRVDPKTKKLPDGSDYLALNPMGMVPMLVDDDGWQLLENTAILPWIASRHAESGLQPSDPRAAAKVQQWLGFINSELHKAVFIALLSPTADNVIKEDARRLAQRRMDVLDAHLSKSRYLVDSFSAADAYLATVLSWAPHCGIDLARWPHVEKYWTHIAQRPSVDRALKEEWTLYSLERRA